MTLAQAIGGAVAVVVGVYMMNSVGHLNDYKASPDVASINFEDSHIAVIQCKFTNCSATSLTDSSMGTSSVYGGALALLQSRQLSSFRQGLLVSSGILRGMIGSNVSAIVLQSSFLLCSAFTNASSVRPGEANGGGGAMYARSVALSNLSVNNSTFIGNSVTVACGATGLPSFSSGGALVVDANNSSRSIFAISNSIFCNCSAGGASISNMAVRGGAIYVSHVADVIFFQSFITNCSIINASSSIDVVSGGSGMSVALAQRTAISYSVFDASGGQDMSETSAGLLILAASSSQSQAAILNCSFNSSQVVLRIMCIDGNLWRRLTGFCVGPDLFLANSEIFQLPSIIQANFLLTGSQLMSLQNPKLISFAGTRLHCALSSFAAFKILAGKFNETWEYYCKPCPPFQISLSANSVALEKLNNAQNVDRCFSASPDSSAFGCPFAVLQCTTYVDVSRGFWTNLSAVGVGDFLPLAKAHRCPLGYCGCPDTANFERRCRLAPLLTINRNSDSLCIKYRTGQLCGGCLPGFTQAMNGRTCISNEVCNKSLWWTWTITILGYAAYSLYIALSSGKRGSGAVSCLFFFPSNVIVCRQS